MMIMVIVHNHSRFLLPSYLSRRSPPRAHGNCKQAAALPSGRDDMGFVDCKGTDLHKCLEL